MSQRVICISSMHDRIAVRDYKGKTVFTGSGKELVDVLKSHERLMWEIDTDERGEAWTGRTSSEGFWSNARHMRR